MPTSLLVFAVATAQVGLPPPFEDLATLDRRIAAVSEGTAKPLDPRLRLLRCPDPATIEPAGDGTLTVRCAAIGWRIRVPVARSTAAPGDILVHRGDQVELSLEADGFAVSASAIAVEDGRRGGIVRVKTSTNAPAVSARVTGPGTLSLSR